MSLTAARKPRIAISTTYMDRRPGKGTAIVIKHSVEELLRYRDQFDITLIHRESIPEDPIYKEFKEIVIPKVHTPKFSGFLSEFWFFLTTKERFDVYYFAYSTLYPTFWLAPAKRIVFAIMDGGPATANYKEKIKGTQPWFVRMWFWRVHSFIALSKFGRDGAIAAYGIKPEKVHIVYNGISDRFLPVANREEKKALISKKYGISFPYILCVSRFDPHKNILRLLDAYSEVVKKDPNVEKLVFVGGRHIPDYSQKVDDKIKALGLSDRVEIAPYIDEEDLPGVYGLASFMVFPSLYEGFGLPVIEAMACETPVLLSDISALKEVSGGFAEFIDPYDTKSIVAGLEKMRSSPDANKERAQKGRAWAASFTWKAHGDTLANVLKDATPKKI